MSQSPYEPRRVERRRLKPPGGPLSGRSGPYSLAQGERERDMRGPCVLCGATDYALSYGGTDICPACDCGNTAGRIRQQVWEIGDLRRRLAQAREENARLGKWVADLQSGMYVNCVYCGHRYGPGSTTPVSMADALKTHIENCPKHPMSALKSDNQRLRELVDEALACLQYPDNGRHYCRWCSAGTHNDWQHEEHCGYAAQCRKIEGVRAKAKALAASEGPSDE